MFNAVSSSTEVIIVGTLEEVADLVDVVRDPYRNQAIVALTSRRGEPQPALDPVHVREIVGPDRLVYFVPTGPCTAELEELLPPRLHVFGGAARIWWPSVDDQSHPDDHPLIHEPYATYGTKALATFRSRFENGPPRIRRSVTDQRASLAQRERDQARRSLRDVQRTVYEIEQAHDCAVRRAEAAEQRERRARSEARRGGGTRPQDHAEDPSTEFRRAVFNAWIKAFGEGDRNRFPMSGYRIGNSFLPSVEDLPAVAQQRGPWVCAMVVSGRAHELPSLALHRLRAGAGAEDPPRVRARDGAAAWRCALKRNSPAAHRLHFWLCQDGTIELASVGHHNDFKIPE